MRCHKCGNEFIGNAVFCSKCGAKISNGEIERNVIRKYIEQEYEKSIRDENKKYYKSILDKLDDSKLKRIELEKNTMNVFDFQKLIYVDGDKIHINMDYEECAKLMVAFVINEVETIGEEIATIREEFHNDRITQLKTAFVQYERAMASADNDIRKSALQEAANACISSINALKKEMYDKLYFFENFPKNRVGKLKYIFRIKNVISNLNQMQETFHMYCNGVKLLLEIDIQNKEYESILLTINREKNEIMKILNSKGYQRLLEVDDENVSNWNEEVSNLLNVIDGVKAGILTDNVILNLVEEKNE